MRREKPGERFAFLCGQFGARCHVQGRVDDRIRDAFAFFVACLEAEFEERYVVLGIEAGKRVAHPRFCGASPQIAAYQAVFIEVVHGKLIDVHPPGKHHKDKDQQDEQYQGKAPTELSKGRPSQ